VENDLPKVENIQHKYMDQWYIVFYEDPHNNKGISLYFFKKLYVNFILGKRVNYFDILEFHCNIPYYILCLMLFVLIIPTM
jgi:hypothetical protein